MERSTLEVTVWMNMPSFYQTDLFNDLAAAPRLDLRVVYARRLAADRVQLGWQPPPIRHSAEWLRPDKQILSAIGRALKERDRFHIINGMWAEPSFAVALLVFIITGSRYAIYSEAPEPGQARAPWKRALQGLFGRLIARRAQAIFAVSRFAEKFFATFGVNPAVIFPFGYFRSVTSWRPLMPSPSREVIFIGQLVERKGLDVLLEAIVPLLQDDPALRLTLIGRGDMQAWLEKRVVKLGITESVVFEAPIPSDRVPLRLATAGLLVLPSRWDGWGLVVNEALAAGVPVVVSDRCGAADLVRNGVNGYVFSAGNIAELRECLHRCLSDFDALDELKQNALSARLTLGANVAAGYLIRCLDHVHDPGNPRPIAPWLPQ